MPGKSLVIVPTYNEKDTITQLIQEILSLPVEKLNIVVIDDCSPDHTAQTVRALLKKYAPRLELIERPGKMGIGSAYLLGFARAIDMGYDFVFEMDADFSHHPKYIPEMLRYMSYGYDLVIGSRRVTGGGVVGWGWKRKLMSKGAMEISRLLLGLKTYDVTSGFRCYRVKTLKRLDLSAMKSNGYSFQEELVFYFEEMAARIKEIPIIFVDRRFGESKLSYAEIVKFFITIVRLRVKKLLSKKTT